MKLRREINSILQYLTEMFDSGQGHQGNYFQFGLALGAGSGGGVPVQARGLKVQIVDMQIFATQILEVKEIRSRQRARRDTGQNDLHIC